MPIFHNFGIYESVARILNKIISVNKKERFFLVTPNNKSDILVFFYSSILPITNNIDARKLNSLMQFWEKSATQQSDKEPVGRRARKVNTTCAGVGSLKTPESSFAVEHRAQLHFASNQLYIEQIKYIYREIYIHINVYFLAPPSHNSLT